MLWYIRYGRIGMREKSKTSYSSSLKDEGLSTNALKGIKRFITDDRGMRIEPFSEELLKQHKVTKHLSRLDLWSLAPYAVSGLFYCLFLPRTSQLRAYSTLQAVQTTGSCSCFQKRIVQFKMLFKFWCLPNISLSSYNLMNCGLWILNAWSWGLFSKTKHDPLEPGRSCKVRRPEQIQRMAKAVSPAHSKVFSGVPGSAL